jgi:hypothetical protein
MGEARVLYGTWAYTKQKVLTDTRVAWLNRKYGHGAAGRIKDYMRLIHKESAHEDNSAKPVTGSSGNDGAVAKDQ